MRGKFLLLLGSIFFSVILSSCSNHDPVSPADNLRVRKNVKFLTAAERSDFVQAVLMLKNTSSPYQPALSYYDQFVSWHTNAFYCDTMAAHMGPAFCPWHRQFLLMFENALRSVSGKDVTIPYWDWTDVESTNSVFMDDFMGGNGDPSQNYALMSGPFRKDNWTLRIFDQLAAYPYHIPYLIRSMGTFPNQPVLPTAAHVTEALSINVYDAAPYNSTVNPLAGFRNYLEGWRGCTSEACQDTLMNPICPGLSQSDMHNRVHLWVGGSVGSGDTVGTIVLNSSPNDPVFWLHHANVDRLWAKWINAHGEVYVPVSGGPMGHNLNDMMWPYMTYGMHVTPKDMLSDQKLGYKYQEE
ncbi:MAG: tyrosinase family protein [Bacteroidetes bacterium]|nr:tyrosinase family protein [Bacteroidota bacterium]